jgi:hypothetical protein
VADYLLVRLVIGPAFDPSRRRREQDHWDEHEAVLGRPPDERPPEATVMALFEEVPRLRGVYESAVTEFIDTASSLVGTEMEPSPARQ